MLALDAMENAPEVWCVLTTRTATLDMSAFYAARKQVIKALRRRWPATEYACLLEFTTGYGPSSGGKRRPHWNLLLKGMPASALAQVREIVCRVWCDHVDAAAAGQHVGEVSEAGGLMRYIALHFQKESQAPPAGFRGQRFNCSRRYFGDRTRAEMREDARDSLFEKRALWRALERGLEGEEAEDAVDAEWIQRVDTRWGLYSEPRPQLEHPAHAETLHVPTPILEAAFRYVDDRELVEAAYAELEAGPSSPPRRVCAAPEGLRRSPDGEP
jgi:hypothetical protein